MPGNTVYGYDTHHFRASYGLAYPALAFHRQFGNWAPVDFTNLCEVTGEQGGI
jgi:hypothetical protein